MPWTSDRFVPSDSSTTHPSVWCRSTPEIKQISILCQFSTCPGNALAIEIESQIKFVDTDTARLRQVPQDSSRFCFIHRKAVRKLVLILAIAWVFFFLCMEYGVWLKARLIKGNTPLHLAMESAHGETAALLIEAGADRSRVRFRVCCIYFFCG